MSLYDDLGGSEAIAVALDRFYTKVLADPRVSVFFDGLRIDRIKSKQLDFLSAAFGGPNRYSGRDLRSAHQLPRKRGLDEEGYDVFMRHFRATLEELGVEEPKVNEVMSIADTGKEDVLGR